MWQWCLHTSSLTVFGHAPMFALPKDVSGRSPSPHVGTGGARCEHVVVPCPVPLPLPSSLRRRMVWEGVVMMEGQRSVFPEAPQRQTPLLGGLCSSLACDTHYKGSRGTQVQPVGWMPSVRLHAYPTYHWSRGLGLSWHYEHGSWPPCAQ